jgi:hypothetical protein
MQYKALVLHPHRGQYSHARCCGLPGQYFLGIGIGIRSGVGREFEDCVPEAILFEIAANERSASVNTNTFGGSLIPRPRVSQLAPQLAIAPALCHADQA